MPLGLSDSELPAGVRDSVAGLQAGEAPPVVSISDIHGFLSAARSALTTLSDHPAFSPVVVADEDGTLHWANENNVLVFNGDLVDRGPDNEAVLELVSRLISEAPPGRVRVTLGNHEAIMLSPDHFGFSSWFSGRIDAERRREFLASITAGHVVAAYRGHNVTYAHAGSPTRYDVTAVNESLVEAAERLIEADDTADDRAVQREVLDDHSRVLGVGDTHPKAQGAGLVWLDFSHLPDDAPPQVVGHTRHDSPQRKGSVYCQNVIRNNLDSSGGEAVFVETSDSLTAVVREPNGTVSLEELDSF